MPHRTALRVAAVALLALALSASHAAVGAAQPAPQLRLPFPAGTSWRVLQGYNGGTHVSGPEQYAFDLVRDDSGATAGSEVIAPAAGTMWWMSPPGGGNGCLLLRLDGGSGIIVTMCHIFARPFKRDERIEAGAVLGTIGPAGTVGNNGIAHLHISLHRTNDFGVTRVPAPFAAPNGLTLEGAPLPADGSANQYVCPGAACRRFVSSNGRAGGPAPSLPSAPPATPAGPPSPNVPLRPRVVAGVTAGAGDCLRVRATAGMAGRVTSCLPDATTVTVAEGPVTADNRAWWRLEGLGWAAGEFLTGIQAPPPPAMAIGVGIVVDAGVGDCLNMRESAGMAGPVASCLPSGARMTITDGPRDGDGHTWWQLDGRGWVAADYLEAHDA